jgi:hypothetical protein
MAGAIWGICATQSTCAAQSGGYILCGSNPDSADCVNTPGTACCVSFPETGTIPSTYCAASCPSGVPLACNENQATCPNGGAGWMCSPLPGIPVAALGQCTPAPDGGGEGGTDSGGMADTGTAETGAGDSATDAPAE